MWYSWREVVEVLKPNGLLIVGLRSFNVEGISTAYSSHWHIPLLVDFGLVDSGLVTVAGDNGRRRTLHVLRKPSTTASTCVTGTACCDCQTVKVVL